MNTQITQMVALGLMAVVVVLKGLAPAFPHAAHALEVAGDTAFQLSLLAINPQAALALLSKAPVATVVPVTVSGPILHTA